MNINRSSMANFGFSPPTRIFEAAGAGACLLCDDWPGIEECFTPGVELIVIRSADDVVASLNQCDEASRRRMGSAFLDRALRDHAYAQRALQAESAFRKCLRREAGQIADLVASPVEERA